MTKHHARNINCSTLHHVGVYSNTMWPNKIRYNAIHLITSYQNCNAIENNTIHYTELCYRKSEHDVMHYLTWPSITLHCQSQQTTHGFTLHCNVLHSITSRYITISQITIQRIDVYHIALCYKTVQYGIVQYCNHDCNALHYIAENHMIEFVATHYDRKPQGKIHCSASHHITLP